MLPFSGRRDIRPVPPVWPNSHSSFKAPSITNLCKLEESRRSEIKPMKTAVQKEQEDIMMPPRTWWDIGAEGMNKAKPSFEQGKQLQRELREAEERGEKEINHSKGLFWGHSSTPEQHIPAVQGLFEHLKPQAPEANNVLEDSKPAPQAKKMTRKDFKYARQSNIAVESGSELDDEALTVPRPMRVKLDPETAPELNFNCHAFIKNTAIHVKQEPKSTTDSSSNADDEETAMSDLVPAEQKPIVDRPAPTAWEVKESSEYAKRLAQVFLENLREGESRRVSPSEPAKAESFDELMFRISCDSKSDFNSEDEDLKRIINLPSFADIRSSHRRLGRPRRAPNPEILEKQSVTAEHKASEQNAVEPSPSEENEFEEVEFKDEEKDAQEGSVEEEDWIIV
jgi:hypothetical protein